MVTAFFIAYGNSNLWFLWNWGIPTKNEIEIIYVELKNHSFSCAKKIITEKSDFLKEG